MLTVRKKGKRLENVEVRRSLADFTKREPGSRLTPGFTRVESAIMGGRRFRQWSMARSTCSLIVLENSGTKRRIKYDSAVGGEEEEKGSVGSMRELKGVKPLRDGDGGRRIFQRVTGSF